MRLLPHSIVATLLAHLGGCGTESAPTASVPPPVAVQPATPLAAPPQTSPVTTTSTPSVGASSASGWQISRYDGRDYGFRSVAFDVNSRGPVFALMTRTGLLVGQLSGPLEEVTGTEPHLDLTRASVAFSYAQGGVPHAFFIDTARPGMAYATRTDTAWNTEPVMEGEGLILPRLAFDTAGSVHGVVVDMSTPSVTHVVRNQDGTWQTNIAARFTALSAVSGIARDPRGVFWMAACATVETGSELSIFRLDGSASMSVGTFDQRCGSDGTLPSEFGFAFRPDGSAHLLVPIQAREGDALVHFSSTTDLAVSQAWGRIDVASIEFGACESTLVLDPQGELHGAFTKHRSALGEPSEIYYCALARDGWRIERIDENTQYRDVDAPSLHMRQTSIALAVRGHLDADDGPTIHLFQRPRR